MTEFRFFKNTPLTDFQNTIHFSNNQERDTFFLEGNHYPELPVQNLLFNFIRQRSMVTIDVSYNSMLGVNYCTFKSDFEDVRYYAYVIGYEYFNDDAVTVQLLIDGVMTFTQGTMLQNMPNLKIERQHLQKADYMANIWELKNNGDVLKTHTKSYFLTERFIFDDLLVVIKSSADLKADFGTVDNPKIKTSSGQRFDGITSPLNLYACELTLFNSLMEKLSDYAWISQNITSLSIIPKIFMEDNLGDVVFESTDSLNGVGFLKKIIGAGTSKGTFLEELSLFSRNMTETMNLFGLDPDQDLHLLRSEYTTSEVYNYSGGQLFIDNGQLNLNKGLTYLVDIITGYNTEMKLYVDNYRTEYGNSDKGGSYVNDSLTINQFDDIPMLINNFDLALSKNANQRELAESKLVTNKLANITDSSANLKDRFFNAASLVSKISPADLFGKFSDEHDFYNQQKAELADMALETPSITNQTNGNSFNIANNMFGLHFKYSKPSYSEMNNIKKYYKLMGYHLNQQGAQLDRVDSMSICNYVKFSGPLKVPYADVGIIEMMKAQFENGVRLWHNNNTPNPMTQNILDNVMVV